MAVDVSESAEDEERPTLRHWLEHTARLDPRVVDRSLTSLAAEDVYTVEDLSVLRSLPRFSQLLTAVTRSKISDALDANGKSRAPLGLDDTAPSWLSEAADTLLDDLEIVDQKKGPQKKAGGAGGFELKLPAAPSATAAGRQGRTVTRPLRTDLAHAEDSDNDDESGADGSSSARSSRGRRRSSRRPKRSQSLRAPTASERDGARTQETLFSKAALDAVARSTGRPAPSTSTLPDKPGASYDGKTDSAPAGSTPRGREGRGAEVDVSPRGDSARARGKSKQRRRQARSQSPRRSDQRSTREPPREREVDSWRRERDEGRRNNGDDADPAAADSPRGRQMGGRNRGGGGKKPQATSSRPQAAGGD